MSTTQRPLRFGVTVRDASGPDQLAAMAARAESLGFDTFLCPDHMIGSARYLAMWPMLTVAARATSRIRIGSLVACNDFRPPALLAKEAMTLDWISGGRLELGLGAGHRADEYERMGISFDEGRLRVERLEEAIRIVKGLCAPEPVHFHGNHYEIRGLQGYPEPVQRPHPPILVGGGARRVLELAGRQADIVSIIQRVLPGGHAHDWQDLEAAGTERQIEWLREAAESRFPDIELSTLVQAVVLTKNRRSAAQRLAPRYGGAVDRLLQSALFLIGTLEQVCEQLLATRERFGISYYVVFGRDIDAFAPVIARLQGS